MPEPTKRQYTFSKLSPPQDNNTAIRPNSSYNEKQRRQKKKRYEEKRAKRWGLIF